jgi:hypothetical protein
MGLGLNLGSVKPREPDVEMTQDPPMNKRGSPEKPKGMGIPALGLSNVERAADP